MFQSLVSQVVGEPSAVGYGSGGSVQGVDSTWAESGHRVWNVRQGRMSERWLTGYGLRVSANSSRMISPQRENLCWRRVPRGDASISVAAPSPWYETWVKGRSLTGGCRGPLLSSLTEIYYMLSLLNLPVSRRQAWKGAGLDLTDYGCLSSSH